MTFLLETGEITHLTAGATAARGTNANPAALTAADWPNAFEMRIPIGMSEMTLLWSALFVRLGSLCAAGDLRVTDIEHQKTDKINHAVVSVATVSVVRELSLRGPCERGGTHYSETITHARTYVCVDGKRYTKHRRGWSSKNLSVSRMRDPVGESLYTVQTVMRRLLRDQR